MCQRKAHGVEEGYYIRREHGNEMRIKRDEFACEMEEGGDWSLRLRNVEGRVVGLLLSTQPCCLLFAVFCITWDHLLLFASSSSHYSFLSFFFSSSSYPSTLHPNSMTHDIGRIMQSFTHLYFNLIKTLHQLYMQKCSYVH